MIGIIDYGAGNLQSIINAFTHLDQKIRIITSPPEFEGIDKIVLPGVGSFGFVMKNLIDKRLVEPLVAAIKSGIPYLGICLGYQILFESSEESSDCKGLGILKGEVKRFQKGKIPQIGWNTIQLTNQSINQTDILLNENQSGDLLEEGYVYFVNSYYPVPNDKKIITSYTDYYGDFASSVEVDNIFATQFHPEKSGEFGINILRRWIQC